MIKLAICIVLEWVHAGQIVCVCVCVCIEGGGEGAAVAEHELHPLISSSTMIKLAISIVLELALWRPPGSSPLAPTGL